MCASDYAQHFPIMAVEPGQEEAEYTRGGGDPKVVGITTSTSTTEFPVTPISPVNFHQNAAISPDTTTTTAPATASRTLPPSSLKEDEDATRGLIGALSPCIVKTTSPANPSRVAWNNDLYSFLDEPCPTATANPKLWAQSRRAAAQGLFEVVPDAVYQVRGLDLSNMTLIEGGRGVIVVDPLITQECAAAALELYYTHRCPDQQKRRPVTAVIYSHSHADHYGGAAGVLPVGHLSGESPIPVIAPEHFMREVLSENVLAGPSMIRRGAYMYGARLPKSPRGQIGCGLGMTTSLGTTTIEPPNTTVRTTGEELVVDGVKFVFQMVPDTEAPAELNFHLPQHRALYIAECATFGMHNIVTLRGALVRDAKAWARYLDESVVLFCGGDDSDEKKTDVLFAGHHWPTFGASHITRHLSEQRDLYTFLHDQTLRLMNQGLTGSEIAEVMTLPPGLEERVHAQGFYGSVSHNVKGIYQRYMGWFDGNPAKLWQLPPQKEAVRYVECLGGLDKLLETARGYIRSAKGEQESTTTGDNDTAKEQAGGGLVRGDVDDLRFAASLLDHAVAAHPDSREARSALADVYETLGFGAENATWRNFYLTGAMAMRAPPGLVAMLQKKAMAARPRFAPNASVETWLDVLSVEIDGFAVGKDETVAVGLRVTDREEAWRVNVSHGALTRRAVDFHASAGAAEGETEELVLSLTHQELFTVLAAADLEIVKTRASKADCGAMARIMDLCNVRPKTA